MLKVFGSRNFTAVRNVYNFKYFSGRLIDYALKKENLILDLDDKISENTRIDIIVMGLPLSIQDKLKRENLNKIDDLLKELSNLDLQKQELKKNNYNIKTNNNKIITEKKPCSICYELKKPNRYHPEEKCWFKTKKINNIDVEDENSEFFDQKNE